MLDRWLINRLIDDLNTAPAVALLGPRQVGKTTLAEQVAEQRDAVYLDLEAPADQIKLSDAPSFLTEYRDKLVILDEIQRAPDLFMTLRGLIDKNKATLPNAKQSPAFAGARKNGQFLFLGSASMDLLRQSSQSLAGRISYIDMGGLNALEIGTQGDNLHKLWLRGGFPQGYLAKNDNLAMNWLENLIRTYLERDVGQMGFNVPADRLRILWTMCAHLQGEPANHSRLADNLGVDSKTIARYIGILTDLLLLRVLKPWHANVKKQLVKSPRYYIRDSGILHRLLGINSMEALRSNPILGKSWEGFVIENIHSVLPRLATSYFYRTADGAEIDLVIKMPSSEVWAIEIKFGVAPKLSKHFARICDDIGADKRFVVYGGGDEFPIGGGIIVTSLARLMRRVQE